MNDATEAGPLLPGSTIGILGGGQLGRMLVLEARRMGYRTLVLDPTPDAPAAQVADDHIVAPLDDLDAVRELGRRCDVATLEWENADLDAARAIEEITPLRPGASVLAVTQHRIREKEAARAAGLATAEYRPVSSPEGLRDALAEVGAPAVLKTCRGGYDGQGQARIQRVAHADAAFRALAGGSAEADLVLEQWVPFEREVSVVTARGVHGEMVSFPVGENVHRDGILDTTLVPARIPAAVALEAQRVAEALAEHLGVVGLLAVEMFVVPDGRVLVNEMAPRPHNSGHYTWEACTVSQFEQHLRAVCGLPLDPVELLRPAAMVNLLGYEGEAGRTGVADALGLPGVALHLYGKREARPGRKMGHLTALAGTVEEALASARAAREALRQG